MTRELPGPGKPTFDGDPIAVDPGLISALAPLPHLAYLIGQPVAEHAAPRPLAPAAGRPNIRRAAGRPPWERDEFLRHWNAAVAATPEPKTHAAIAEHFIRQDGTEGIEPGSLRKLRRRFLDK